jgi:hypothetical protein
MSLRMVGRNALVILVYALPVLIGGIAVPVMLREWPRQP